MIRMHTQRGATLLVALIMLVLLTLFAVSALNTSTTNLKVVGNMQARTEALNAAQQTIDTVISTPLFSTNPAGAVLNACGAPNTLCVNAAGSFVTNPSDPSILYTIRLTPQPTCVTVRAFTNQEAVNQNAPECTVGTTPGSAGIQDAMTQNSLCADSVWEITAESVAAVSGAKATVTQGIGIRISTAAMATSCDTI